MEIDMIRKTALIGLAFAALTVPAPAWADFCIQVNGGPFSGALGFFRFKGDLPADSGQIVTMRGRVAGLGPVFGTAVVPKDSNYTEIGATFFVDATQGQINI